MRHLRTFTIGILLLCLSACRLPDEQRLEEVCFHGTHCIIYHAGQKGGLSCDFSRECTLTGR